MMDAVLIVFTTELLHDRKVTRGNSINTCMTQNISEIHVNTMAADVLRVYSKLPTMYGLLQYYIYKPC